MFPLATGGYYDQNFIDYEFWTWSPSGGSIIDTQFKPKWRTVSSSEMNTVSFGDNFPNTIISGEVQIDSSIESGSNFLIN